MSFTPYGQYGPGQMMQPGYPYAQQPQQPQQVQQIQQGGGLSGHMVASREEATISPVDFLAGISYFPDMSHGKIYVKIFDRNTGGVSTVDFIRAPQAEKAEENPLEERVRRLEERVRRLEEEMENAKRRGAMAASRRGAGEYGRYAAAEADYPEQRQPRPGDQGHD